MAEELIGERYRLIRKVLSGDPVRGLPDLWQAQDAGDLYYIKLWRRRGEERADLRALWNREVRGLMRLQGYPGAGELFVKLRDLGTSAKHFYAVLDGGRRMLLSEILQNRSKHPWLQNLGEVGRRRMLWEGLLRLSEALSILHDEGTLHRSISPASVFVGPDGQGDFRLSGFEWSLRLAGREGAASKVANRNFLQAPELDQGEGEYSTGTDWFDFGLLTAEIFGVSIKSLKKRPAVRVAVSSLTHLREAERAFILQLLEENPDERLSNSDAVTQSVRNILRELNITTAGATRELVLAIRLTPELELQRIVEAASGKTAPADKPIQQRDWIANDLRGDVRVTARLTPYPHFVVKGEMLEYRVRQWTADSLTTWDIGFCESVEVVPRTTADDQHFSTGLRKINVQLYPHVRKNQRTIRDRSAQWDKIFTFRTERRRLPAELRDVHDFFRITQQLETVLTAAQICPVNVIEVHRSSSDTTIDLSPFDEIERNELARHLGLQSPAEQLRDWFDLGAETVTADDDDDPKRDRYALLDRRTIGNENSSVSWRFVGASPHPKGLRYHFRAQGSVPVRQGKLYLARNHGGTLAQIRRRHKAIEDMRSHEGLLRMLADPRAVSRHGSDTLPPAAANIKLDRSKLEALERLWLVEPSFAIQGPPGTGKTTLIKAFGDRLFNADQSAQILITAHSHHTVDDVRTKLSELFQDQDERSRPILLRLGSREPTEHDIEPVTATILRRLSQSELMKQAPEFLKARMEAVLPEIELRSDNENVDLRTMRLLVQDAANVTFATSNSAELADLATRGRRFDWSIIEEAGKAHGFDMAVALQESHRLLLIGDHRQLPPFNARLFKDLLGDPLRVRKAIQTGVQFAPGLIDASLVDEDDERDSFENRCSRWREMVALFGNIFENSFRGKDHPAPAATLTDQHRMHPDIADLVGKVFYPDGQGGTILNSPDETHERFAKEPPFKFVEGAWLPAQRIVWCDVPWVQKKEFAEGEVDGLFVSEKEAQVVIAVLEQLAPRDGVPCETQILSPYNDQLQAIHSAVDKAYQGGRLKALFAEPFDIMKGKRLGATVDEFQGSEADIVIVSLVRNNALVPWKSVGFLKEANRMNVLLSRARHKLIIVGSWDFFASRCDEHTSSDDEYAYIGTMMKCMKEAQAAGHLVRVVSPS
ncbi:AAA domain-containing protein [Microvirga sesbaniae]|uniref:AAA domain-containing protein n=1 Tax=Microvirga sesbaniae TaxID=681392 RepID=UPI0021C99729|nr:AAA domain-containing protein [Microvirga sp. HBU67692]